MREGGQKLAQRVLAKGEAVGKQHPIQVHEPLGGSKVLGDEGWFGARADPFRGNTDDGADDDRLDDLGPDDAGDEFVGPHRDFRFKISNFRGRPRRPRITRIGANGERRTWHKYGR